ncbi:MAG: HEAT repeat domain-containing protein [Acidobacteriota bacterium]
MRERPCRISPTRPHRAGFERGFLLVLVIGWLAGLCPAWADLIHLSLFEKPAMSTLVVRGKVIRGDLRLAEIEIEEVLKGFYDEPRLWIVFRLDNFTRRIWEEKVEFSNGERVLLFMKPFEDIRGENPRPDRFSLVYGHQGKVTLPPEGANALLEATRRFVHVQEQADIEKMYEDLQSFLSDPNPLVLEAGLQQMVRLRLGRPEQIRAVLPILDHAVPDFRRGALMLLAQMYEDRDLWQAQLNNEDHLLTHLLTRAREDEDTAVRKEAVRTLEARGKTDILPALEQIAGTDPKQSVRFQAQLAAYNLTRR